MEQNTADRSNDNARERSREVKGVDASERLNKRQLEGTHTKIEEVFNKELYLNALVYLKGKDGEYAIVQVEDEETGEDLTISNGSRVVMEKLRKLTEDVKIDENGAYHFKKPYRIMFTNNKADSGREYHDITSWG